MQISPFHYEGKWGGFSSWCKIDLKAQRSSKQPPPCPGCPGCPGFGSQIRSKKYLITWLYWKKVLQSALMPHSMEKMVSKRTCAPQFYRGCFEGVTCYGTSADLNSQGDVLLCVSVYYCRVQASCTQNVLLRLQKTEMQIRYRTLTLNSRTLVKLPLDSDGLLGKTPGSAMWQELRQWREERRAALLS